MVDMKPLTTSIYTFCDLIAGGYLYVDKTANIYELIKGYKGQYFLARPRRFGKSLLISTLKSIFLGQRELFEGLAIADCDYDWKTYPVIHLDLGTAAAQTVEELERTLTYLIDDQAALYDIKLSREGYSDRFKELISLLTNDGKKVVLLVDEYDKPLLGHLEKPTAPEIQRVLKEFYSVIKTTEPQQRFVLLTGVSKFSKVSIFSDLNNLTDLTMSRKASTLLGYTQQELEDNFPEYITELSKEIGKSYDETLSDLREWYNGYRFEESAPTIYNPVSVMKCFDELKFKNYWFETGSPSFLINMMRKNPIDLDNLTANEEEFSTYEPNHLATLPLLVQTGYLTIKDVTQLNRRRSFRLGFPNFEIEESFSHWLALDFTCLPPQELSGTLQKLYYALNEGRIEDVLELFKVFFSQIPNNITLQYEKYYQTIFFTVFKLIGAMVDTEVNTNTGRIDAVIKTPKDIFIFEFKLHGTTEEAMAQIHQKQYATPYRDDARRITLIGVEFNADERNITNWLIE